MSGFHESTGLSITAYRPTIVASGTNVIYTPAGEEVQRLTPVIDAYNHEIAAWMGYDRAALTIQERKRDVEEWIEEGLGRHVEVTDPDLEVAWEGVVNMVEAQVGPLSVRRGPLLDVANRVTGIYAEKDTSIIPPAVGATGPTLTVDREDSKLLYGVLEKILSLGEATQEEAEAARDMFLLENREPDTSKDLALPGAGSGVTLGLLGYGHFLGQAVYLQVASSGTTTVSAKMAAVLDDGGADPNALFSSANADIEANGILVASYEGDWRPALTVLKELASVGEPVNDRRTLFGVYEGRRVVYATMPTALEYVFYLTDAGQRVEEIGGAEVKPWKVLPGKWLQFGDFLPGATDTDDPADDPRNVFIERVGYDSSRALRINGSLVGEIAQRLAQMGLAGR